MFHPSPADLFSDLAFAIVANKPGRRADALEQTGTRGVSIESWKISCSHVWQSWRPLSGVPRRLDYQRVESGSNACSSDQPLAPWTEVFRDWELVHPWSLQWQDAQVAYFLELVLCDTRPQVTTWTTWLASIAFEALSLSCVLRNIIDDVDKKFGIRMHLYVFVHLILCGRLARRHAASL